MKHNCIFVLTLAVFGAASAYSQIPLNTVPSRAVGTPQLTVTSNTPNLVEGREFYGPQGIALDNSVSPPRLYVSDSANNRVLAWQNAGTFATGQKADLAIGQPDMVTTFQEGPGVSAQNVQIPLPSVGLASPSGLAVDKAGNLYVVDGGNNRVLRYPKPFAQTGQYPLPDLAIGQANLGGYKPNYPTFTQTPTAQGLFFSNGTNTLASSLAFDSSGDLWVIDSGNVRILRFNASSLTGTGGGLTADLELGQPDFVSTNPALSNTANSSLYILNQFISPLSLAFDPASGNLFVADLARVLVFPGPNFSSGMSASPHVYGVFPTTYTYPTGSTLQTLLNNTLLAGPSGIFFPTGSVSGVGVVDAGFHRIMIFPPFANWPTDGSPPAVTTPPLGQPSTICPVVPSPCTANSGRLQGPSNSVFSAPGGAAYNPASGDLYLVDTGNNRVLDLPQQGTTFGPATRVLGQDYFNTNSPNLIEGREFQFSGNGLEDAAMAIDNRTGTPHLYVADPYNNRVLGFYDLRKFCFPPNAACPNGSKNQADIVLGQANFTTALVNYPSGDPNKNTNTSLYRPVGLLVDSNGNLYVADSGNGRVLRFPAPFAYAGLETAGASPGPAPEQADLVLGQQSFTTPKITDPSATNMAVPYGLAFTPSCNTPTQACPAPNGLLVSDQNDNRVLYIPTTNGTFVAGTDNGKAATLVFGQPGFNLKSASGALTGMFSPHHISCDTDGRVYVADTGNNRVLIFADPHTFGAASGAGPSTYIGSLSGPEGVYVSPVTGEIWVANTGSGTPIQSLRYTSYDAVYAGSGAKNAIEELSGAFDYRPLAVFQDQNLDLFVADTAHRVAIYYPGMSVVNAATFVPAEPGHELAPLAYAAIFKCAPCTAFPAAAAQAQTYPIPFVLGDLQVLVDGTQSPVDYVAPGQINFIVPNSARTSGNAEVEVVQQSTGQVIGAAQVIMGSVAPGAFECPGGQTGPKVYLCAVNQDGTVNAASNPAQRGQFVTLYMTGQGNIPGAPADGVSPTAIPTPYTPTVVINGVDVNSPSYQESSVQHVLYSGLDPFPGSWQINVLIPATVVTNIPTQILVTADGRGNWDYTFPWATYIYVK